jgi:hypothetical protein
MRCNQADQPSPQRSKIGARRSAGLTAKLCRILIRLEGTAAVIAVLVRTPIPSAADRIDEGLRPTSWGEQSDRIGQGSRVTLRPEVGYPLGC